MFKIVTVSRYDAESVKVLIDIDADAWRDHAKRGDLGQLYGVDISNRVFREYGVKAYNPTVDHNSRAVKGVKRLTLYYADAQWKPAPLAQVIPVDFKTRRRLDALRVMKGTGSFRHE
jgi:hypothetical protein